MMLFNHTREHAVAAKRLDSHPNMAHRASNNSDTTAARHTPAPHTREPVRSSTGAVQGRFLRACRQEVRRPRRPLLGHYPREQCPVEPPTEERCSRQIAPKCAFSSFYLRWAELLTGSGKLKKYGSLCLRQMNN